jgi:Family of unknown function (DUF6252)
MKKYLILLVPLLFLMAQCHKTPTAEPEPDLPPATQEGKGTIGCYINGKPWVPKPYIAIGISQFLEVVFDESKDNFFGLYGRKDGTLNERIAIFSFNTKLGDNTIAKNDSESFYNLTNSNGCVRYYLDTSKVRRLTITKIDKVKKVISGTFEFTANNNCSDTLRFTDGRFDTKY